MKMKTGGGRPEDKRAAAIIGRPGSTTVVTKSGPRPKARPVRGTTLGGEDLGPSTSTGSFDAKGPRARVTATKTAGKSPKASVTVSTSSPPKARPKAEAESGGGLLGRLNKALKANAGNNQAKARERMEKAARK